MKLVLLDLRTLSVVLMTLTAFLSLAMFFIWRVQKTYVGFEYWTAANLMAAVGFLCLSVRGVAPDFLSIVLGNCLAIGSNLLCLEGNRKFLGLSASQRFSFGVISVYALFISYFTYLDNSIFRRILVTSLFIGIVSAKNWFVFRRGNPTRKQFTYQFARLTYLALTILMFLRIVATFAFSDIQDFYAPDYVQSITYLTFIVFAVLWTFQYMILNNERLQHELQTAQVELEKLATTDFLTGLHNQRNFLDIGQKEIKRANRFRHPLTVMMFDIDYFKLVNDTHGHAAGDLILAEISALCQRNLRGTDVLGRLGGEEFGVMLPHTKISDALTVAEHLRTVIEENETAFFSKTIKVTASFGVCCSKGSDEKLETVLERADALLYEAKRQGRNRVVAETTNVEMLTTVAV